MTLPIESEASRQRDGSGALRAEIRRAAFWPFIAAVLLLYFGFSGGDWVITSTSTTYKVGAYCVIYAMKAGGVALALVTLILLLGLPLGLALDAVAAVLIGAAFLIGGGLMGLRGDMQGLLYVVFGIVFIAAGRNSFGEYRRISPSHRVTTAGGLPLFGGGASDSRGPDQ
jgi:hypothetical protein